MRKVISFSLLDYICNGSSIPARWTALPSGRRMPTRRRSTPPKGAAPRAFKKARCALAAGFILAFFARRRFPLIAPPRAIGKPAHPQPQSLLPLMQQRRRPNEARLHPLLRFRVGCQRFRRRLFLARHPDENQDPPASAAPETGS